MQDFVIDVNKTLRTVFNSLGGNKQREGVLIVEELQRIEEALGRFGGATFNHGIAGGGVNDPGEKLRRFTDELKAVGITLDDLTYLSIREQRQVLETVADLNRQIAEVDLDSRRQQADLVIQSIHEQAARVEEAINDQMDVQKRAVLRSVRLRFDAEEIALRRSFTSRLTGAAGDPFETSRIVQEAQREIALLSLAEQAAGNNELEKIRSLFEEVRSANDDATDRLVLAVEAASEASDVAFESALALEPGKVDNNFASYLAAVSGNITGATEGTRLAILNMNDGISVDLQNVAAKVATSDGQTQIIVALGAVRDQIVQTAAIGNAQGILGQIEHNTFETDRRLTNIQVVLMEQDRPLQSIADYTLEAKDRLRNIQALLDRPASVSNPIPDYGNPEWGAIRSYLKSIKQNTCWTAGSLFGWYSDGAFNRLQNIQALLESGRGGGSGGGQTINFEPSIAVRIDTINTGGGGGIDIAQLWRDGIEDAAIDSLYNGRLGAELGTLLRALGISTSPSIPSSIRT